MAIRKIIESDISGKADAATVTFGLGGTWYEVDLTEDEKRDLEAALGTYLKVGRKTADGRGERKPVVPATTPEEREQIRAWGRKNGFEAPDFGRVPKKLQAAYDKAHNIKRTS